MRGFGGAWKNRIGTFPQQRIIPTINVHILKVPGVSRIAYLQLNRFFCLFNVQLCRISSTPFFFYLNLIWLGEMNERYLTTVLAPISKTLEHPLMVHYRWAVVNNGENGFAGQFQVASVCKWTPRSRVKITNKRDWLGSRWHSGINRILLQHWL